MSITVFGVQRRQSIHLDLLIIQQQVPKRVGIQSNLFADWQVRFYRQLQRQAIRLYYVRPAHGLAGPWVAVYRL